ncbi:uncharacterized protein LOC128222455 [Mya arenaria]|uniref:uncharacterized protein LOC128222455 n=1 Tax=Mya arenaria TaxID=6604 RepID=UPI0022E6533C|nr:uncharacterized protein LOC128222455 [Mya arenaria]
MSNVIPPSALFLKDPVDWVAQTGCECSAAGIGYVHDVQKGPAVYTAGTGGALPGLTPEETAILAGILTGLATFLFLLLPILCCLCPLCAGCCGRKKAAAVSSGAHHRKANMARSDNESFWSTGSFGKGDKMDYEHLYGVDMKLPRPWVDNSMAGSQMHEGGWEGIDVSRDEIDAGASRGDGGMEIVERSGMVSHAAAGGGGGGGLGGEGGYSNAGYSSMDRGRGGGDEVITEYTTTRRVDMTIGAMSPEEAEGYYAQNYGGGGGQDGSMTRDNFMRIYHQYRNDLSNAH